MTKRANFGSKLGVILATAGSAVGLGNVWRFPFMTGQNGGAAFILVYLFCVVMLGIPFMISEFIVGRHGAANTARAYSKLAGGGFFSIVGYLGVLTGFLIFGYYIIVCGWTLFYLVASIINDVKGTPEQVTEYFTRFSSDPIKPIGWTIGFMFLVHFVIARGVQKGIEKSSKAMMPLLFILLLVIVVASCMLPGAMKGVEFLFKPDFGKLDSDVFLNAMGQAFYSLSIGMGCICTYASYFSRQTNLPRSAIEVSLIDAMVAILAGLMIFPAAFSVGVNPDSGPSLIFITLPNVFQQAFASVPIVGYVVAIFFYALLGVAALTSAISLHEVSTAFFSEELRIGRNSAAWIVTCCCSVIAVFCSLSLGKQDWLIIGGRPLFDWFDYITGQIFLPIVGLLTALFVGWYLPHKIVRDEYTNWGTLKGTTFKAYLFCVKYVCVISIAAIFLHQIGIL